MASSKMTQQFFTSRAYVAGDVLSNHDQQSINLRELPPFLRCLLVADGTVTKAIEAYFWEPIEVRPLHQQLITLDHEQPFLESAAARPALQRVVSLIGEHSGITYATAISYIHADALSADRFQQLENEEIGIGELLRESELESYREIVDFGITANSQTSELRQQTERCNELYRTYRVLMGGEPAIQITEYFPIERFS